MIPCAMGSLPACNDFSGTIEMVVFGKTKYANAFAFYKKVKMHRISIKVVYKKRWTKALQFMNLFMPLALENKNNYIPHG